MFTRCASTELLLSAMTSLWRALYVANPCDTCVGCHSSALLEMRGVLTPLPRFVCAQVLHWILLRVTYESDFEHPPMPKEGNESEPVLVDPSPKEFAKQSVSKRVAETTSKLEHWLHPGDLEPECDGGCESVRRGDGVKALSTSASLSDSFGVFNEPAA